MKFIKRSTRHDPKVSLILLDWSVRESFHLLHYLGRQSVDRDQFEVVFIEYYSRQSERLREFAEEVDTWVLLEMPDSCIYHKHLMYNCGFVFCRGEIVVICDSDAMVKESFIKTIIGEFEKGERIVLHLDQFRNIRKDFYPFNYPTFEDVLGDGCINNVGGKTKGILDTVDPLHSGNYGACMCARRTDLIAIGGADEHIDYLGLICGPYEITFRLVNCGFKEVWHEGEFLYHTWHPGQAWVDNYVGPHDGMQMSKTALQALVSKRVLPLVENESLRSLRNGVDVNYGLATRGLISPRYLREWNRSEVSKVQGPTTTKNPTDLYRGFKIIRQEDKYDACPLVASYIPGKLCDRFPLALESPSLIGILEKIDDAYPPALRVHERLNYLCLLGKIVLSFAVRGTLGMAGKGFERLKKNRNVALSRGTDRRNLSIWKIAVQLYKKVKTQWLELNQTLSYTSSWTSSLISNLYFMREWAGTLQETPVLLTSSLYLQICLGALTRVRFLPLLRVIRLKNGIEVLACFEELGRQGYRAPLILGSDLYTRHYGLIRSCPQSKNIFVV